MNTKIRIRLLLVVLAFALAVPCVAGADTIPIGYVIYQNDILPGAGDDNPGTNAFYFGWLVDPLAFSEASFSVTETGTAGSSVVWEALGLPLPLDDSAALGGFWFLTTDSLTEARFRGTLVPGVLTSGGRTYAITDPEVVGGMTADAPGFQPFGLGDSYDLFVLEAKADPIPVPVPEGGPGTLALTTWALLLAAAARRFRP